MVKINRHFPEQDRRGKRRHTVPMEVYTEEIHRYSEKLINASDCGCCIESPLAIEIGEHVLLHFIPALAQRYRLDDIWCLDGCVMWAEKKNESLYRYGFRFIPGKSQFLNREYHEFTGALKRVVQRRKKAPAVYH